MPNLIVLRGLPASGKSTRAKELVRGGYFRANRDDLRASLYPGLPWSGQREKAVKIAEKALVRSLLEAGYDVVVDDTNLSQSHMDMWNNLFADTRAGLANTPEADEAASHVGPWLGISRNGTPRFTVKQEVIGTDIRECIRRDNLRDADHVGESVIWKMATENGWFSWGDEPIVVVDVDGTLADGEHRNHLLANKSDPDRWKKYFQHVFADKPVDFVARWVQELAKECRIVIVSGRPDNFPLGRVRDLGMWTMARETSRFVREACGIPYHSLFMRAQGDKRPDTDVKRDILKRNLKGANIAFVLDDRPKVIKEVWGEAGIKCYPVRGAVEDF